MSAEGAALLPNRVATNIELSTALLALNHFLQSIPTATFRDYLDWTRPSPLTIEKSKRASKWTGTGLDATSTM